MAISYVGGNTATGASGSVTVSLSGLGLQENDVVIAVVADAASTVDRDVTADAGWTELADLYANDNNDTNLGVFWRRMGATPDTSVTLTSGTGAVAGAVKAFRGVHEVTAIDATTTTATGTNGPVANAPSITPATTGACVVAIGGCTEADTATAPANYNSIVTQINSTSNVMMAHRLGLTGGSPEDPAAFGGLAGQTSDCWAAASVALRPSAVEERTLTVTAVATVSPQAGATQGRSAAITAAATTALLGAYFDPRTFSAAGVGATAFDGAYVAGATLSVVGAGAFAPLSAAFLARTLSAAGMAASAFLGEDAGGGPPPPGGAYDYISCLRRRRR